MWIEVLIRQLSIAERGEIRPDAARRPDVVAGHQVTAGARPLVPVEEEPRPFWASPVTRAGMIAARHGGSGRWSS